MKNRKYSYKAPVP